MTEEKLAAPEALQYEFYDCGGSLVRRRRTGTRTYDAEVWVPRIARRFFRKVVVPGGSWHTSLSADRGIYGIGDDPWSGPEFLAHRISLDEAKNWAERHRVDLFAGNAADPPPAHG